MSNGDPAVIEKRGKSNAARKGRYDGSYTGTEQRLKNRLMQQFRKTGEGPGGNSEAYRNASCWCACGKLKADGYDECQRCLDAAPRVAGLEAWIANWGQFYVWNKDHTALVPEGSTDAE